MDAQEIAKVLGAVVMDRTGSEHPGYSLRLVNLELGVRLRIEVPIKLDEVRLFVERFQRRGPSFIGTVSLDDVRSVIAERDRGEVRFISERTELSLKRNGIFAVSSL